MIKTVLKTQIKLLDDITLTKYDYEYIAKQLAEIILKDRPTTFAYIPRRGLKFKDNLDTSLGHPSWYPVELGNVKNGLAEVDFSKLPTSVGYLVVVDDITHTGISLASVYFYGSKLSGVEKIIGVVGKDYASAAHISAYSSEKYRNPIEFLRKENPQAFYTLEQDKLLHLLEVKKFPYSIHGYDKKSSLTDKVYRKYSRMEEDRFLHMVLT